MDPNGPIRLFERRFKSGAGRDSDKLPKQNAANVKRVATALKNAASTYRFESLLEPEQLLALRAASRVMLNLARVLDEVCILSQQEFKKCEAARKVKAIKTKAVREAQLDDLATARWSCDARMLAEAADLAEFLKSGEPWLQKHRRGAMSGEFMMPTEVDVGDGPSNSAWRIGALLDSLKKEFTPTLLSAVRRHVAAIFEALKAEDCGRRDYYYGGRSWKYVGLVYFEDWRADRKRSRSALQLEPVPVPGND